MRNVAKNNSVLETRHFEPLRMELAGCERHADARRSRLESRYNGGPPNTLSPDGAGSQAFSVSEISYMTCAESESE